MTEKFYKNHPEHFFRERKARIIHDLYVYEPDVAYSYSSPGTLVFKAGTEVVIKRKYKGLGCLDPKTDTYVAQIPFGAVELITDGDERR